MNQTTTPATATTNEPAHTPGPWKVERMNLGSSQDRRSGFVVNGPDADPLPVRICDLRCAPESPFAMTQANARLIAAAPELLAALEMLANQFEDFLNDIGHPDDTYSRDCIVKARAALQSARSSA